MVRPAGGAAAQEGAGRIDGGDGRRRLGRSRLRRIFGVVAVPAGPGPAAPPIVPRRSKDAAHHRPLPLLPRANFTSHVQLHPRRAWTAPTQRLPLSSTATPSPSAQRPPASCLDLLPACLCCPEQRRCLRFLHRARTAARSRSWPGRRWPAGRRRRWSRIAGSCWSTSREPSPGPGFSPLWARFLGCGVGGCPPPPPPHAPQSDSTLYMILSRISSIRIECVRRFSRRPPRPRRTHHRRTRPSSRWTTHNFPTTGASYFCERHVSMPAETHGEFA